MNRPLEGRRLLVVEDEYWVARELADFLEERGCVVVALTGHLENALNAAEEPLHGALVDVQLGDRKSYPLIDKLRAAGVPVILMTGFNRAHLREDLQDCKIMAKPFQANELETVAMQLFQD